jgi:DNA-directed RNA polymerase subunit L
MKLFTLHPSIYKLNYYVSLEENLSPEVKELKNKLTKLYGTKGLIQRSKRLRKVMASLISATHIELILKLRKENSTYGKTKIAVLERDHKVLLSESSVGRILDLFPNSL